MCPDCCGIQRGQEQGWGPVGRGGGKEEGGREEGMRMEGGGREEGERREGGGREEGVREGGREGGRRKGEARGKKGDWEKGVITLMKDRVREGRGCDRGR